MGPLSLYESHRSALAITLEQKLVLLGQSTRPDWGKRERVFRIGIRGTKQQKVVMEGSPIFFHLTQHSSGGVENIAFANGKQGCRMIPQILDNKSLLLKLEEGEEIELQLMGQHLPKRGLASGILALTTGTLWGADQFFQTYGGDEYQPLGQKQKLEIEEGSKRYFLFVSAQDFLTYSKGEWRKLSSLQEAEKKAPLAKVEMVGSDQLAIEAWDEEGFPIFDVHLRAERKQPLQIVVDQVITSPKLRSAKQISCKIGKKRIFLKPGDWLIRTQTGWHKLTTLEEIEAYLNHQLRGELLVVDSIDSHGTLKGHCFDSMRTQVQPFMIQAVTSKKKTKKKGEK